MTGGVLSALEVGKLNADGDTQHHTRLLPFLLSCPPSLWNSQIRVDYSFGPHHEKTRSECDFWKPDQLTCVNSFHCVGNTKYLWKSLLAVNKQAGPTRRALQFIQFGQSFMLIDVSAADFSEASEW